MINKSRSTPLITVIVPVYNVAKLLERCVKSILAQTYPNLEIILIDDGSTDMSGQFCDVFAHQDSHIRVLHQPNRGLSGARNAGLDVARGDFVAFVDSDDTIDPDLISYLLGLCQSHRAKIAVSRLREIYPTEPVSPSPPKVHHPDRHAHNKLDEESANIKVMGSIDAVTELLVEKDFSVNMGGKLFARDLFDYDPFTSGGLPHPLRFPEGKLYEDTGTAYKLILQCDEVVFSTAQLYNYYQNPNSITHQTFSLQKLDLITLTDQMCDHLEIWARELPAHSASSRNPRTHIQNLTKKRRMHARFSILRQMILIDPKSLSSENRQFFLQTRGEIIKYLRSHKNDILRNPLATRRDKFAMCSLLLGLPVFKRAWLTYQKKRH